MIGELDELILQLREALNMTIVVVTHELESAFKIADRITVLDQGKQIITGTKDETGGQQKGDFHAAACSVGDLYGQVDFDILIQTDDL